MRLTVYAILALTSYHLLSSRAEAEDRLLLRDGEICATILLGDARPERARLAADALNTCLEKAGGVRLPVRPESEAATLPAEHTVVVVGGGTLAAALAAQDAPLAEETYLVKTLGRHVLFLGSDTLGDQPEGSFDSPATLWAVGYFLDRHLGVRWLWPGDLGTVVPRIATIGVPDLDVRERPAMVLRRLSLPLGKAWTRDSARLSRHTIDPVTAEAVTWCSMHLMGQRERLPGSHSFRNWWEKYHKTEPEIFATLPEGMKQPSPVPDRVKLCVANPRVTELILEEWRAAGRPDVWPIGPNDGQGYCVCAACRALDIPTTLDADPLDIYWNRDKVVLTGRYLDLWRRVLDRMRPENPRVKLATLAYANYRIATPDMPPLGHTDALTIFLVPDSWNTRERQSFRTWKDHIGAAITLRPNWWHVGHAAPYLPLHDTADFVRFALDEGLVAASFDSLLGYWGTQGANYYLVARLCSRPDLSVEQILDEYASGFAAAAPVIRDYLAFWEDYSQGAGWPDWTGRFDQPGGIYERTLSELGLAVNPFWGSWSILPILYTDDILARARHFLDRAASLAAADRAALARIDFLRAGLTHLEWSRDVVALANAELRPPTRTARELGEQRAAFERKLALLRNLRADLTRRHVVWDDVISGHEERRKVKMSDRFGDAWSFSAVPPEAWAPWQFRKDPDEQGVAGAWFAAQLPEADTPHWSPITVPAYWDKTDAGPYQGYAWYRTTFRMPAEWDGERVCFSFDAVDEQAWVYLNGAPIGEHTLVSEGRDIEGFSIGNLWNVPFSITVPIEQLRLGEDNLLVVRVHNAVGAGGIWRPLHVHPPLDQSPLFLETADLGQGIPWLPEQSYSEFAMSRVGSGRVEITVDADSQGVIMEAGADGAGWALYVHDGELIFQAGKGSAFAEAGQTIIRTPLQPGRHSIEWSVDQRRSKAMLRLDGRLAGSSEETIYRYIAGNDVGGIGRIHGAMCRNAAGWYRGEAGTFSGIIHSATVWPDKVCF